jgi:hypothetical protein
MEASKFTYHYNASALGLGGVLKDERDVTTIVPSLASVALAPSGGEGFTEIANYDKDGVSFSNASSRVIGYDSGHRTFTTSSDVYITNLNLFGRVKVAILQTSISSTRDVLAGGDMRTEANPDKARFAMHSIIRGLTIDGIEVVPEFDLDLCECPTYEQFTTKIGGACGTYARQFGVEETELEAVLTAKPLPIRASFVSDIRHRPTDQLGPRQGFKLPVKNFGYVHFGELVVKPGRRRVNLLRFEFDATLMSGDNLLGAEDGAAPAASPYKGTMTVMSQDSNGAPSWP